MRGIRPGRLAVRPYPREGYPRGWAVVSSVQLPGKFYWESVGRLWAAPFTGRDAAVWGAYRIAEEHAPELEVARSKWLTSVRKYGFPDSLEP